MRTNTKGPYSIMTSTASQQSKSRRSAPQDAAGPDDDEIFSEKGPERTCIVTRQKGSPDGMIRFVLGPDHQVVPDIRRKLPGRGVWVTGEAARVADAVKRQAFAKGFKAKVSVSPSLVEDVEHLFRQDCLQFLSLVNKSGSVTTGYAKVEAAVAGGTLTALLHARDAGSDGVRKLGQALNRRFGEKASIPQIKLFGGEELDLALGRTNVIHAALTESPTSEAFLGRCRRLLAYCPDAKAESDETAGQMDEILQASQGLREPDH